MFGELLAIDGAARDLARRCDPTVALAVTSSIERTAIGGGALSQLFGTDRSLFQPSGAAVAGLASNADNQAVIDFVAARVPRAAKRIEAQSLHELVALLCGARPCCAAFVATYACRPGSRSGSMCIYP